MTAVATTTCRVGLSIIAPAKLYYESPCGLFSTDSVFRPIRELASWSGRGLLSHLEHHAASLEICGKHECTIFPWRDLPAVDFRAFSRSGTRNLQL
jgi:hypothetical protein